MISHVRSFIVIEKNLRDSLDNSLTIIAVTNFHPAQRYHSSRAKMKSLVNPRIFKGPPPFHLLLSYNHHAACF